MKIPVLKVDLARFPAGVPHDRFWFDEHGLRLSGLQPAPHAQIRERRDQLELLLALAFRQRLPTSLVTQVVKAAEASNRGDHALANLRLALANLSYIPDAHDLPARVTLASTQLAEGMTSVDLLEALCPSPDAQLLKFDPGQPRVPSGSGRQSGQWTSSDEGAGAPSRAALPLVLAASRATSLFAADAPAAFLSGLGALAATIGAAAAVGGVLLVPWQNDVTSKGSLPGDTGHSYSYNSDEGLLQIRDASGEVVAAGQADRQGVFHDADTGIAFARRVDGALLFDDAQISSTQHSADAAIRSRTDAETDDDEPKLCPEPGPDQLGSEAASDRAKAYQEQISRMINPQRPLDYGLAMNLPNPSTGKIVHFDECAEQTGTMIEAKGPGFDGLLGFSPAKENVTNGWLSQSLSEVQTAGTRQVEWYFAEDYSAAYARDLFAQRDQGRAQIIIKVQPAEQQ